MKKIKILLVVLAFGLLYKSQIFVIAKNLEQNEKKELNIAREEDIVNNLTEEEKEKYYVEEYKIKQIIEKGIFTIVHYEHENSGLQILVFFDDPKYLHVDPLYEEYSKGELFIKCSPPVNFVALQGLCDFLNESLQQRLNSEYSKQELKELGLYHREFFEVVKYKDGCGICLKFNKYDKQLFADVINAIVHPQCYKSKEFVETALNKSKKDLERKKYFNKETYGAEFNPKLFDRFIYGKFADYSKLEELEKIKKDEEYLGKLYDSLYDKSHFLIKINGSKDQNYKEVMKDILKQQYFEMADKKDIKINKEKYEDYVEKEPYRKIELNAKNLDLFLEKTKDKHLKDFKYKAKLFWDISKIPLKERFVLLTKNQIFWDLLQEEIKKMGYTYVTAMQNNNFREKDQNSLMFDGLYYIDIYGSDEKCFEKEKLKENGKNLIKTLYEKIKNFSDEELLKIVYYDEYVAKKIDEDLNFYSSERYYDTELRDCYIKSYCLTNNPFSKKYFNFKDNRKIEFKYNDIIDIFRKYNNIFEQIFNNNPDYIDLYYANGKYNEEEGKFSYYLNPVSENFGDNPTKTKKDNILSLLNEKIIYDKFFKPNLIDKGLIMRYGITFNYFIVKREDLKEVENYIFNKFKNEIKEYVPKEDEVNKIISDNVKNLNLSINSKNKEIKEYEDILNNKEKFAKYIQKCKENCDGNYKGNIVNLKKLNEEIQEIKNKKNVSKEEEQKNLNSIANLEKKLTEVEKNIKEYEENVNNENYYVNEIKKQINFEINLRKEEIQKKSEKIEIIKKLTHEDFINFYKNFKFSPYSNLIESK